MRRWRDQNITPTYVFHTTRMLGAAEAWFHATGAVIASLNEGYKSPASLHIPRAMVRDLAGLLSSLPRSPGGHAAELHAVLVESSITLMALLAAVSAGDALAEEREKASYESLSFRLGALVDRLRLDIE